MASFCVNMFLDTWICTWCMQLYNFPSWLALKALNRAVCKQCNEKCYTQFCVYCNCKKMTQKQACARMSKTANSPRLQDSCWLCWWSAFPPNKKLLVSKLQPEASQHPKTSNRDRNVHGTTIPNAEAIMVSQQSRRNRHQIPYVVKPYIQSVMRRYSTIPVPLHML